MTTATYSVVADGLGPVPVTVTERGAGHPFLLLHGGAGPQSVAAFAEMLAKSGARVLVPVHPGFGGTPRPEYLHTMRGLALTYLRLLDDLDLTGVTVIGNSIGGWIAAEMAIQASPRIAGVVLADAGGLQLDDYPGADFFSLTPDQVTDLAYYRPDKFRIDVATLPDQQKAAMAGNRAALQDYTEAGLTDPGLLGRLGEVRVPTLVVWGEADRIYPPQHGEAFAKAIPGARLVTVPEAGHLPQLEAPEALLAIVLDFHPVTEIRITGPADGEVALSGPITLRIMEDGSTTSHRLGLAEIVLAPHTDGPPQHRHAQHDEGFYVVSGTVRFTSGPTSFDAPARTLVMVPPGAAHSFANPGDSPAVILNTFTPDHYIGYFRELHDQIAAGQPPSAELVARTMARYGTEPAQPPAQ
jgi:pimeloyl-ACP methyl ester carboxylesterase/mannose-6-phosphate isomerase-like protein (cupin superfamily)